MICNPFIAVKPSKGGIETGETYYIDRKVYLKFVETGRDDKGKAIGSVMPVVHEEKIDIDELVNSHKNEVGVKNLIRMFSRTGDLSLFNQRTALPEGDYSNLPDKSVEEIFKDIPKELRGDLSVEQFLRSMTTDQFKKFAETLKAQSVKEEKEVKKDE